jgi:hypothetical protein
MQLGGDWCNDMTGQETKTKALRLHDQVKLYFL